MKFQVYSNKWKMAHIMVCPAITLVLLLCSVTYYEITMGYDLAKDAHCGITVGIALLGTSLVTSQWVMTLLCVHIIASQCIMTLL